MAIEWTPRKMTKPATNRAMLLPPYFFPRAMCSCLTARRSGAALRPARIGRTFCLDDFAVFRGATGLKPFLAVAANALRGLAPFHFLFPRAGLFPRGLFPPRFLAV